MSEMNWKECVEKAEAFKAVGQKEIYLDRKDGNYPWEYVTSCEGGGSHRLEISTDVWFRAVHPCGLKFRWSFDIEPRQESNGRGYYIIDVDGCRAVLAKLKTQAARDFIAYLSGCAEAVGKKAEEWEAIARSQREAESALRRIIS